MFTDIGQHRANLGRNRSKLGQVRTEGGSGHASHRRAARGRQDNAVTHRQLHQGGRERSGGGGGVRPARVLRRCFMCGHGEYNCLPRKNSAPVTPMCRPHQSLKRRSRNGHPNDPSLRISGLCRAPPPGLPPIGARYVNKLDMLLFLFPCIRCIVPCDPPKLYTTGSRKGVGSSRRLERARVRAHDPSPHHPISPARVS